MTAGALAGVDLLWGAAGVAWQGCTQCADNAGATAPETQAAYRHAILLLLGAAVTIFVAGLALMRKYR